MRQLLTLLVISFAVWFAPAQKVIPAWFEQLPESPPGTYFAVGYSGKYIDRSLAREAAISTAVSNLAKQLETRLVFELEEFSDGRYRLLNPSFELCYDAIRIAQIYDNFTALDSSFSDEGYFILIAYPAGSADRHVSGNDKEWSDRPKWTNQLPRSRKYNYGIGMVSNYSSWVRAWKDADEYARFDLGKNLTVQTQSTHTARRDSRFVIESHILRQSYDETIRNSTIVSRWYDAEKDTYYSLCRQPRN